MYDLLPRQQGLAGSKCIFIRNPSPVQYMRTHVTHTKFRITICPHAGCCICSKGTLTSWIYSGFDGRPITGPDTAFGVLRLKCTSRPIHEKRISAKIRDERTQLDKSPSDRHRTRLFRFIGLRKRQKPLNSDRSLNGRYENTTLDIVLISNYALFH